MCKGTWIRALGLVDIDAAWLKYEFGEAGAADVDARASRRGPTEGARTELIGGEGGGAGPPRASSGDVEAPRPRPCLLARPDARGSCDMFFLRTRFQSAVVSDGFVASGE